MEANNEIVYAFVPLPSIALSYLTVGGNKDFIIYPSSTKSESRNILVVMDREQSLIFENYLVSL
jgi:Iap family predicted aminopeptidase